MNDEERKQALEHDAARRAAEGQHLGPEPSDLAREWIEEGRTASGSHPVCEDCVCEGIMLGREMARTEYRARLEQLSLVLCKIADQGGADRGTWAQSLASAALKEVGRASAL